MATLTYVSSITQVTKPPGGSARPWPTAGAMGKTGQMVRPSGSAADPAPSSLPGEPTQPQLRSAAATFALLSSPTRLHLAWLMAHETYGVGDLAVRVGLSIATTSQHLGKLRLAGVVSARRQGRHTYYTIDDPHVLALIEQIFSHIAPDGTLAPDPPS
jgi:DNA-binding transcriptional ArsR family regulator